MTSATLYAPRTSTRRLTIWVGAASWAIGLGLISGLSCVGVRLGFRALQWIFLQDSGTLPAAAVAVSPWRRVLTPALGALLAMAVLWAVRRWSFVGHSVDYVEAVRLGDGKMAFLPTLWRTLSSAFSIATGAAVGREGSMIQFSTALTAWVAERFPVRSASLFLHIACGVAAAVAAVYQAPLAGVFFATEIVLGEWPWLDVPYLTLASVAGWLVSRELLDSGPLFLVSNHFAFLRADLWALPLALLLGLAAPVYQALLRSLEFTSSWRLPLLWSGLAVGALSLLAPAVWGNGDVALTEALRNPALPSIGLILIVRLVATTFCVGSGTVGGVFTPTLFAGAAAGMLAAHLVGAAQPALLGVFGLSTLLAAVTHAPLMASFMAVELTGQWQLWPALVILNLLADFVAQKLSPHSLYHIATPTPTEE